ncbi:MAG: hypothetical protein JOZ39_08005 [Chloroflexi bacterium]|nr:hypothetical protein [Chloroflexota bacterium]
MLPACGVQFDWTRPLFVLQMISLTNPPTESADDLIEACYEAGWTDGLPVVPPTPARVDKMLGPSIGRREEVVAVLAPAGGVATLERIAANAVMAGCLPEYLPLVEAAVRAVADPRFMLDGVVGTEYSASPLLLIEGPAAKSVGLNGRAACLGSGSRANATIGRALNLCLQNIAGARAGEMEMKTFSHPGRYSYCFTENLDASPWPSLSVDRGFGTDDTTLTAYHGDAPLFLIDLGRRAPEDVLMTIADSMTIPGSYHAFFRWEMWLVMSPTHAGIMGDAGWSRRDVANFLYEHARVPARRLRNRGMLAVREASWLAEADDDDMLPIIDSPDNLTIVVAGGEFGPYSALIFGRGGSVTIRV